MRILMAPGLSLPVDVVTQTVGVLAKRRAGKSYTARRFAEQLVGAGQQVVVVDPKGDWWGIRAHRDGKGAGLPITILGGERGDVPLEVSGGELVARLVVEERVSALLDLSLFRKADVARFMTGFLEALYRLKAREIYRTPVMLIIDEADAIAPQKPQHGEERMLGAAEDIVRRGGQRGIGCTLITQRSAVLNKNVLTQVQVLIALRTIAPQDLKALDAWIDVHGTPEERKTLMASLPALPVGDAWIWSPGWPSSDGIFERVHVLPIETFDSGETPKPGQKRAEPKLLADVDLDAVRRQMADVVQRAAENDPKALRARIAALERDMAAAVKAQVVPDPAALERARSEGYAAGEAAARRAIATLAASATASRERAARAVDGVLAHIKAAGEGLIGAADALREPLDVPEVQERREPAGGAGAPRIATVTAAPGPTRCFQSMEVRGAGPRAEGIDGPMQKILDGAAELEALGIEPAWREQLAFICGYTNPRSGGFSEPLGRLIAIDLVEAAAPGQVKLTPKGRAAARLPERPMTSAALQERILRALDAALHAAGRWCGGGGNPWPIGEYRPSFPTCSTRHGSASPT